MSKAYSKKHIVNYHQKLFSEVYHWMTNQGLSLGQCEVHIRHLARNVKEIHFLSAVVKTVELQAASECESGCRGRPLP